MKEIYKHQKSEPSPDDWCHLVDRDFEMIGEHLSDHQIEAMTPSYYKKYVKAKVRSAVFIYLEGLKSGRSKVRDNVYSDLEKPQVNFSLTNSVPS